MVPVQVVLALSPTSKKHFSELRMDRGLWYSCGQANRTRCKMPALSRPVHGFESRTRCHAVSPRCELLRSPAFGRACVLMRNFHATTCLCFERSVDASLVLKSAFVAIRRMNGFIPKRLPPFLRRCDDQGARDGSLSSHIAAPTAKRLQMRSAANVSQQLILRRTESKN